MCYYLLEIYVKQQIKLLNSLIKIYIYVTDEVPSSPKYELCNVDRSEYTLFCTEGSVVEMLRIKIQYVSSSARILHKKMGNRENDLKLKTSFRNHYGGNIMVEFVSPRNLR